MNLYAYVENNPVDFTDPTGLLKPGFWSRLWGGLKSAFSGGENVWTVDVPISFDDDFGFGGGSISNNISYRGYVDYPTFNGGGNWEVNVTADPDPEVSEPVDLLTIVKWWNALETMISEPRCKGFIDKYLGGADLVTVLINAVWNGSIVWSDKVVGGQVQGAMDKPPINIKIHSRWLNQNNADNFKKAVNTLRSELAHATKEERGDEFMAKLLHDNGETAGGLPYKGPEAFDLTTKAGRNAYQGYSSMWWHQIEGSYCNMFFVK